VTDNTGRYTKHRGRYPSRRGAGLEALTTDEVRIPPDSGWGGRIRTSEWRDQKPLMTLMNQQVIDIIDSLVP
jgi:hypothetical protein